MDDGLEGPTGGGVAKQGDVEEPGGGVSATPVRLDHRYELVDRTGSSMGTVALPTIHQLVKQGRLFATDLVSRDGEAAVALGDVPEIRAVFDETLPPEFQVAHSTMRPRPDLAGPLDRSNLAGVFARLHQEARTGRLFLISEDRRQEKVVIFQRGVPVNAMSNISEEQIGEVLIAHGLITQDLFRQAVAHRRDTGGRIGSALVALQVLSPRDLHRALSLQAMERLLNAFRQQTGSFRFVPDETAASEEILLFASVRELIESGLHASLTPQEIAEELAAYGDVPLEVRTNALQQPWARAQAPGDAEVLGLASKGLVTSQLVQTVASALRLTMDEARRRVLSLMRFGLLGVGEAALLSLDAALARLQTEHAYDVLRLPRGATSEQVAAAAEVQLEERGGRAQSGDSAAVARARDKIRSIIEQAARVLADEDTRAMYDRALQLGLDFEQPEVRLRIEYEHWLTRGKALLVQQKYQDARRAFLAASQKMPEDPMVYVHLGWSQFLGSNRDKGAAYEAIREVERALRLSNELDVAHATVGKIHRLAGNLKEAEDCLRRAIQLNPHNNEAQSELRLIFARELDGKGPKGNRSTSVAFESQLARSAAVFVVVFAALFGLANHLGGGVTVWPDGLVDPDNRLLASLREVPAALQVIGNLEHYYDVADPWWWARRGTLLVVGLLGMIFIVRDRPTIAGPGVAFALLGIVYGVLSGFLSGTPRQLSPLGIVLGMSAFHVLVEQIFFIGFLFRAFQKDLGNGGQATALTGLCYGIYQCSYVAVYSEPVSFIISNILQVGAFGGAVYAALAWRSGGMLAPFLTHLVVNTTMMVRANLHYSL